MVPLRGLSGAGEHVATEVHALAGSLHAHTPLLGTEHIIAQFKQLHGLISDGHAQS